MNYTIYPKKLKGTVNVPPSKSMAHRGIICACLSQAPCMVTNLAMSDDIIATIEAMKVLGFDLDINQNILTVGKKNNVEGEDLQINCNESGSTLRFLVPISLINKLSSVQFIGQGKLGIRPMKSYYEIFDNQGIQYQDNSLANPNKYLDLKISGQLKSGTFELKGDISSQFISGLMFALPLLSGDSQIILTSPIQSASYLNLTIKALQDYGIEIKNNNYQSFFIKGGQKYLPRQNFVIEGDYSQAAFFEVANHIGSEINILGLDSNSLQGDKVIIDMLKKLKQNDSGQELVFDGGDCPDIIPIFSVACALRKGKTIIKNIARLKIKECDRMHAIIQQLNLIGANIKGYEDSLIIEGVGHFEGGVIVESYKDHRIAMMMAIAGTVCKLPIVIKDCECVSKSYPNFFEHFRNLGGEII